MIKLDFYRLLMEQKDTGFVEEPDVDCRYTPYRIFVLETRLFPLIYKLVGEDVDIYPQGIFNAEKNRMDVHLKIVKIQDLQDQIEADDVLINLKEDDRLKIEKRLNEITSKDIDYALIDVEELYNSSVNKYPFSWFASVFEFALTDTSYNPFIAPEGIYLTFNPNSEYKKAYYTVCQDILKRIDTFYKSGVVVLKEDAPLIKNWNLIQIDEDGLLYQAGFVDHRFADNMVDFLLQRVQGDEYISFKLPNNLTKRHGIIATLQGNGFNPFVENSFLKIKCDDLINARKIASLIDAGYAMTYGRVMIVPVSRMSEVFLYSEYCQKNRVGESIGYFNDGNILFSVLLEDDDVDTDDLRLKMKGYAVSRLIEVSKISKLKAISPHSIIEQEYSF